MLPYKQHLWKIIPEQCCQGLNPCASVDLLFLSRRIGIPPCTLGFVFFFLLSFACSRLGKLHCPVSQHLSPRAWYWQKSVAHFGVHCFMTSHHSCISLIVVACFLGFCSFSYFRNIHDCSEKSCQSFRIFLLTINIKWHQLLMFAGSCYSLTLSLFGE